MCSWRLSFPFNEKLVGSDYLEEQTKDAKITLPIWTNKVCTTSLSRKYSIFYANKFVTSMYWVVKWATLRKLFAKFLSIFISIIIQILIFFHGYFVRNCIVSLLLFKNTFYIISMQRYWLYYISIKLKNLYIMLTF